MSIKQLESKEVTGSVWNLDEIRNRSLVETAGLGGGWPALIPIARDFGLNTFQSPKEKVHLYTDIYRYRLFFCNWSNGTSEGEKDKVVKRHANHEVKRPLV